MLDGIERQDVFEVRRGVVPPAASCSPALPRREWLVAAVADGVGSAARAREGAEAAARGFIDGVLGLSGYRGFRPDRYPYRPLAYAAQHARATLERTSQQLGCHVTHLGTTLLGMVLVEEAGECTLDAFQAGDGLVALAHADGRIEPLLDAEDTGADGGIHTLQSERVRRTLSSESQPRRMRRSFTVPTDVVGVLLMTDGVSDDLLPLAKTGPMLVGELLSLPRSEAAGMHLLELLSYEKRGSFDDRTLVAALRRKP